MHKLTFVTLSVAILMAGGTLQARREAAPSALHINSQILSRPAAPR